MKNKTLFYAIIGFLVLVATTTGIFYRTPGVHIEYVTVRGEMATFQGNGLYQYDPASLAREGIIWDTINLFFGLPLLAIAIYLTGRHSLRGRLLLGGLLCYFFYVYLMYATMMSFNCLFLVYVAIYSLSLVAFIMNLQAIDLSLLPTQISARFPHRLFIGYMIVFSVALVLLWANLIVSIMIPNQFPAELAGTNTLETQALDLGLIVPLALATGILLRRRSPWGYLLTGISITHGAMMFITVPAWIAMPLIQDGEINLMEAIPFLFLCLVGLALAAVFYWSVQEKK
ncbi:MAG: hypothetical protein JXB85_15825 [Anaerolineales bacterium]|nr:hypothetical protein [Anaerolineales bacterium]